MNEKNKLTNNIRYKKNGGITLIALIITIIVMLILVAITISVALNGGLFEYAGRAGKEYDTARLQEELQAGIYGVQMEYYKNGEEGSLTDYIFSEAEGKGQTLLKAELGEDNLEFKKDDLEIVYKGVYFDIEEDGTVKQAVHHEWTETAHVEATCTQDGYIEETCSVCGETRRTVQAVLGHDWNTSTNKCKRCGQNFEWIVPEGGRYSTSSGNSYITYTEGQTITRFPQHVDHFWLGDYEYAKGLRCNGSGWLSATVPGWGVRILDKTKTSYDEIMSVICELPVVDMAQLFNNCSNMTTVPQIPVSVTYMAGAFSDCSSLTIAPEIPDAVTNMTDMFKRCVSITASPEIPDNVTSMTRTFLGCTALTIAPKIPNSVTSMENAFAGCTALTVAPDMSDATNVINMKNAFSGCTSLIIAPEIPNSVTDIGSIFSGCTSLTGTVIYNGTKTQWDSISKKTAWKYGTSITTVRCTDGDIEV